MPETEHRYAELQRGDGRTLRGKAVVYGDLAQIGTRRERFAPGAFGPNVATQDVLLTMQHDRARPLARSGGGGLTLTDTREALEVRAELPDTREATDALQLVDSKILRGLSVEFRTMRDEFELATGTRVILAARLIAVSLVDRPAYGESTVSARALAEESARRQRRREIVL